MKIRIPCLSVVIVIIAATVMSCSSSNHIPDDKKLEKSIIKNMVDSFKFVFIPQYVSPTSGGRRSLNSGYQLSVSKDRVISSLPFFGRGYVAPVSPADVDFDFTSTRFTHTIKLINTGWNISIKPLDQKYILQLYCRIFDNGSASLNITSIDRSTISYDGYIIERKDQIKNP